MAKMIHPNLLRCYIAITKGNTLNNTFNVIWRFINNNVI